MALMAENIKNRGNGVVEMKRGEIFRWGKVIRCPLLPHHLSSSRYSCHSQTEKGCCKLTVGFENNVVVQP